MMIRESMTRVKVGGFIVRVWRNESLQEDSVNRAQIREQVVGSMKACLGIAGSAQIIMQLTDVSAVEILDRNGDGEVWYADWP